MSDPIQVRLYLTRLPAIAATIEPAESDVEITRDMLDHLDRARWSSDEWPKDLRDLHEAVCGLQIHVFDDPALIRAFLLGLDAGGREAGEDYNAAPTRLPDGTPALLLRFLDGEPDGESLDVEDRDHRSGEILAPIEAAWAIGPDQPDNAPEV
ncbi:hypothetical protein LAZ40_09505 [Cereibacter sphaeroides]|uniref:hypothetical protein n=1 Tax=Cereibacter sphaeroides TaxID=1063 RepID=UPI001F3E530F|nr:hypothetical protein [Cereibacter sphaeroides]MCE6959288.1 hypothetical protein [Cereibacter sphaeroides]MCE6972880.1 hypothetical protein [Cereibacter sphaeroides]